MSAYGNPFVCRNGKAPMRHSRIIHTQLTDATGAKFTAKFTVKFILPNGRNRAKTAVGSAGRTATCRGKFMKKTSLTLLSVAAGSLALAGAVVAPPIRQACAQRAQISYADDIAPIFRGWCVSCHEPGGEGYKATGLDLTSYAGVMKGSKFGPMVIPGQPDSSNLIVLIAGRGKIQMPFGHKPLPSCLQQNVWTWIFQGAKDN